MENFQVSIWDRGAINGVASLDSGGKIPIEQIPSGAAVAAGVFLGVLDSDANADTSLYYNGTSYVATPAVGVSSGDYLTASTTITTITSNELAGLSFVAGDKVQSNGVSWVKILKEAQGIGTGLITSDMIADGTIRAGDLFGNTLNSNNMGQNSITAFALADDAVDELSILDGAVTFAKLATTGFATGSAANRLMVINNSNALALSTFSPSQLFYSVGDNAGLNMNGREVDGLSIDGATTSAASRAYVDREVQAINTSGSLQLIETRTILGNTPITSGQYAFGGAVPKNHKFVTNISAQYYSEIRIIFKDVMFGRTSGLNTDFRIVLLTATGTAFADKIHFGQANTTAQIWVLNGYMSLFGFGSSGGSEAEWTRPILDTSNLYFVDIGTINATTTMIEGFNDSGNVGVLGGTPSTAWAHDAANKRFLISPKNTAIDSIDILVNGSSPTQLGSSTLNQNGSISIYGVKR